MTVPTTKTKAQALGNGSTTAFPFDFELPDASYLTVTVTNLTTLVDSVKVLNTDYTIASSSIGNPDGGTVTFTTAPAADTRITMRMVLPTTQLTDLRNQGDFQAETHEKVFDRLARVDQQQQEQLDRAFALVATAAAGVSTTIPAPVAGRSFKWNSTGTGLVSTDNDPDQTANSAAASASAAATSETNAANSATSAANSATAAQAAAAVLPAPATGDANKFLSVNAAADAYEKVDAATAQSRLGLVPGLDVAHQAHNHDGVYGKLAAAQNWTAAQRGAIVALTSGTTITPQFALGNNYSVVLGVNTTLANPTNLLEGQSGFILIQQDATGGRTMAFGSAWKFEGAIVPSLTATPNAIDILAYYVESSTRITTKLVKGVA